MPSFLFTATTRENENITSRIEADNLAQARHRLEFQGHSEITFFESELSDDTRRLFGEAGEQAKNVQVKQQVAILYDTRIRRTLLNILKVMAVPLGVSVAWQYLWPSTLSAVVLAFLAFLYFYCASTPILFHYLYTAHNWGEDRKVRTLAAIAKFFNKLTINKIPESEIDVYLACADAREGSLDTALARIAKYKNHEVVSERLYQTMLTRVFASARLWDRMLEVVEASINDGVAGTEEMIDYAVLLARRHGRTAESKEALQHLHERELTPLADLFIQYCQAVIEVEDDNYVQASFYLDRLSENLRPFKHNSYLVGLKSEINAFRAIVMGHLGKRSGAAELLEESKIYLSTRKEFELIQRCEAAIS